MRNLINIIFFSCIANLTFAQITDGYTDKASYRAGETVTFFINAPFFVPTTITVFIKDAIGGIAATVELVDVMNQPPIGTTPWMNGFGYVPCVTTWTVPATLASGRYTIATSEPRFPIPIIIKAPMETGGNIPSDIIVVIPTNTDEGYNTDAGDHTIYGAHSFYDIDPSTITATFDGYTYPILSFLRPMQSFQHDYYDGFLKWFKINASHYSSYTINMIADKDMDDYEEIKNADVLIVIGHSEYWTRQARLNFDRFVDDGRDAIVLSGNTMWWQVRYDGDQIKCYKQAPDPECEPLLKTKEWWHPEIKYSILGSLGADSHQGFAGNRNGAVCSSTYNGYNIIQANSPLLSGASIPTVLKIATGEFDLTLVKNGGPADGLIPIGSNPVLDLTALGFYRAELIGFDQTTSNMYDYQPTDKMKYAPLMVFQKTCTSGKTIIASSNDWCREESMFGIALTTFDNNGNNIAYTPDGTNIQLLTRNMIDLLLANSNVFSELEPSSFTILPATPSIGYDPVTVSYEVTQHGSIDITPCGIELNDACATTCGYPFEKGFKFEMYDGSFEARIIDCGTARHGQHSNHDNSNPSEANFVSGSYKINVFPNPTTGSFNLFISDNKNGTDITIFNLLDQIVLQKVNTKESYFTIDLSNQPKGLYMIKVVKDGQISTCKLICL